MAQLYVYGKVYDRFDETVLKLHIDEALIEQTFLNAMKTMSDDEIEEFVESEEIQKLDWALISMLTAIMGHNGMFNEISELIDSWKNEGAFCVEMEEFSFGVAKTAQDAKLQWLKLEDKSEDW